MKALTQLGSFIPLEGRITENQYQVILTDYVYHMWLPNTLLRHVTKFMLFFPLMCHLSVECQTLECCGHPDPYTDGHVLQLHQSICGQKTLNAKAKVIYC